MTSNLHKIGCVVLLVASASAIGGCTRYEWVGFEEASVESFPAQVTIGANPIPTADGRAYHYVVIEVCPLRQSNLPEFGPSRVAISEASLEATSKRSDSTIHIEFEDGGTERSPASPDPCLRYSPSAKGGNLDEHLTFRWRSVLTVCVNSGKCSTAPLDVTVVAKSESRLARWWSV